MKKETFNLEKVICETRLRYVCESFMLALFELTSKTNLSCNLNASFINVVYSCLQTNYMFSGTVSINLNSIMRASYLLLIK